MDFAVRLRVLVDERADAARLCARQMLRHHPPGRQHDRVVGVRVPRRTEAPVGAWCCERVRPRNERDRF